MANPQHKNGAIKELAPKPLVLTLSGKDYWPYNPSARKDNFFALPLELRQQIYSYLFYTPDPLSLKILRGWRECPQFQDLDFRMNGTALLGVSQKMRVEALDVYYREAKFRVIQPYRLDLFMATAVAADSSHLRIRRISIVPWKHILGEFTMGHTGFLYSGAEMVKTLTELPSLKELELGDMFIPRDAGLFDHDDWFQLMDILSGNRGSLKILAASEQDADWGWGFARRFPGCDRSNFGRTEPVLAKTYVEVRNWSELVELNSDHLDFNAVFALAMANNWSRGPLKSVRVEHAGREYIVWIWGVPQIIRDKESKRLRAVMMKSSKEAIEREQAKASRRRPKVDVDLGFDEDEDVTGNLVFREGNTKEIKRNLMDPPRGRKLRQSV